MKPLQIGDLTIRIPIIQGGMGIGISLSRLASAVANAGGVGVISTVGLGLVYQTPGKNFRENNNEAVIQEIRKARQLTDGVLGVNIMSVLTNFMDLVKTSIDEKIDIIFSGGGLPLDLPKYLTEASKTKLVPIVSSARAAKIILQKWVNSFGYVPDAFVVEGPKAGGHLGFNLNSLSDVANQLENIVKEVVKVATEAGAKFQKMIPVIAAGGLMSGKDVYDIMQAGASAVQLGTRFAATEECDASDEFKQAFINAEEKDIQIIKSPVGMPGRAIDNGFLQAAIRGERKPKSCRHNCIKTCDGKNTNYCIADALLAAYHGRLMNGFVFTGANAYLIKKLTTVPELFKELISGFHAEKAKAVGEI